MTKTKNKSTNFTYRPDIDGLRAIAVLAVVIFHLGFERFEGGFLGVDVFFVVSGFLITSIIAPKIMVGTFSFKDFYLGRVRRLIPPALTTVAFTFLACAILFDPADFINFAKSAIAAMFSVSNILFFTEAGYWDAQSELKPLLHTWSLGVEEQFYIFWPILLLLVLKLGVKRSLALVFGIATIIGLIASEWILRANPSAAFYLLPARFFEFSIGATFAFLGQSAFWGRFGSSPLRLALGIIGLIVLLSTIWLYKGTTPFPGINALLPCLATAAILLSGSASNSTPVLGQLLGNPVMTWLGKLSYSLYLVHWPVVSIMRYEVGLELHLKHQLIAILLISLLTLLLYYGVEQRLSARAGQKVSEANGGKRRLSNGRFAIRTGLATLALSAVSLHVVTNSGWSWRFSNLSLSPEQIEAGKSKRFSLLGQQCRILDFPNGKNCDETKPLNILVFGNSHESDGYNFLSSAYGQIEDIQLIGFGETNRCDIVKSSNGTWIAERDTCTDRLATLQSADFSKRIDAVAYSANKPFSGNKQNMIDILSKMKTLNPNLKIITFGGYINTELDCSKLINDTGSTSACVLSENVVYHPDMDKLQNKYNDFIALSDFVINYGDLLCNDDIPESCESQTPNGTTLMYDRHHLSFEFAQYAGQKFTKENPKFLEDLFGSKAP